MSDDRDPLSEEQMRVNAAALVAYPKMIKPDDAEMAEVCESLAERGNLAEVYEGEGEAAVAGYVASEELRAAMDARAAMN